MWNMPLWHHDMLPVQWGAVIGASLAGAVCDVRKQRIPNRLTLPVFLSGLAWAIWVGGLRGWVDAVCGCLILATPFVILFAFAGGGAGDAKMMGALGSWLGVINGVVALVSVVVAGALCGLGYALVKKQFRAMLNRLWQILFRLVLMLSPHGRSARAYAVFPEDKDSLAMPYGIPIFSGVCAAALGVFLWRA